jgi:hypothetical protein
LDSYFLKYFLFKKISKKYFLFLISTYYFKTLKNYFKTKTKNKLKLTLNIKRWWWPLYFLVQEGYVCNGSLWQDVDDKIIYF